MTKTDLADLTVTEALAGLGKKAFSCSEYADALIKQSQINANLNGFVSSDWDALRASAAEYDRGRGKPGRLAGIPLALKDNINTMTLTSAAGTTVLRRFTPKANAPVAQALFDEGALLGGKTNMHELAFGATSNNGATGPCRNPWNPSMITGGSSGGTSAVVSARMMPGGLGSDTGASVRLPAALCGIFGFRPSMGRYSEKGVVPCAFSRDTVGPMARTAEDAALIDAVVTRMPVPYAPVALKGLRLGVPRKHFYENLQPEVARIAEEFLSKLSAAGADLVECEVINVTDLSTALFGVTLYEFRHGLEDWVKEQGYDISIQEICDGVGSPDVKATLAAQLGPDAVPETIYREGLSAGYPKLQRAYAECFASSRLDALVFPVSPVVAPPIGEDETIEVNGKRASTIMTLIQNVYPSANGANCGASLPAGLSKDGLPVGMEIDGLPGMDARIFGIALAVEELVGTLPRPKGI